MKKVIVLLAFLLAGAAIEKSYAQTTGTGSTKKGTKGLSTDTASSSTRPRKPATINPGSGTGTVNPSDGSISPGTGVTPGAGSGTTVTPGTGTGTITSPGTSNPGSGTSVNPGSGTSVNPGSGTMSNPGSGTTVNPGSGTTTSPRPTTGGSTPTTGTPRP